MGIIISASAVMSRAEGGALAGTMGSAPEEPSSSVATGGSDETGVSGKGTSGTCHVCGGALRRGNVSLARQCVTCKTRYHASDCGKRRSNAGYGKPYDVCPKVRRAFRLARPASRVERDRIRSSRTDAARARGTRAPPPPRVHLLKTTYDDATLTHVFFFVVSSSSSSAASPFATLNAVRRAVQVRRGRYEVSHEHGPRGAHP